jgi:hypothetical protein
MSRTPGPRPTDNGRCPHHNKIRYITKADAKMANRQIHAGQLNVYRCHDAGHDGWHLGHLPTSVRRGKAPRQVLP